MQKKTVVLGIVFVALALVLCFSANAQQRQDASRNPAQRATTQTLKPKVPLEIQMPDLVIKNASISPNPVVVSADFRVLTPLKISFDITNQGIASISKKFWCEVKIVRLDNNVTLTNCEFIQQLPSGALNPGQTMQYTTPGLVINLSPGEYNLFLKVDYCGVRGEGGSVIESNENNNESEPIIFNVIQAPNQ